MAPDLDLSALLGVLDEHQVAYVLIGGMAAVTHGSPFPTEDVDITPATSPENLTRLVAALDALDARTRTEGVPEGLPFACDATSLPAMQTLHLTTRHGDLDLSFVPSGTNGYDDLRRDAAATELFGVVVSVASLADVIRSKQAANRPKDQRVLPTLRDLARGPTSEPVVNQPPERQIEGIGMHTDARPTAATASRATSRLTADIPVEDAAELVETARVTGLNKVTIVVRALRVFAALVRAEAAGGTVTITYADGRRERLLIR